MQSMTSMKISQAIEVIFKHLRKYQDTDFDKLIAHFNSILEHADQVDFDKVYSIDNQEFTLFGTVAYFASIISKRSSNSIPNCIDLMLKGLDKHNALAAMPLLESDRAAFVTYLMENTSRISHHVRDKDRLLDIISFAYLVLDGQAINCMIQPELYPQMPLYMATMYLRDNLSIEHEAFNHAVLKNVFKPNLPLALTLDDNGVPTLLKPILDTMDLFVQQLNMNSTSCGATINTLCILLDCITDDMAISILPNSLHGMLGNKLTKELGSNISLSTLMVQLLKLASTHDASLKNIISPYLKKWIPHHTRLRKQASGLVEDFRDRESKEVDNEFDNKLVRKIITQTFGSTSHIMNTQKLKDTYKKIIAELTLSPKFNSEHELVRIADRRLPQLRVHKIDDGELNLTGVNQNFHFFTVGENLNDNNDRPIIIKLLGTDGDATQMVEDFIGESMDNDSIIVAFNYKLSKSPTDSQLAGEVRNLTNHIITEIAQGNATRVTLHGHSLGAAIAVMAAAMIKQKDSISVGVCHDRGFSKLAYPASPNAAVRLMVSKALKMNHIELNAGKKWQSIDSNDKLMLVCDEDEMVSAKHNRLPKSDRVCMEMPANTSKGYIISGYQSYCDTREQYAHMTQLRSMTVVNSDQTGQDRLYAFARGRMLLNDRALSDSTNSIENMSDLEDLGVKLAPKSQKLDHTNKKMYLRKA